MSSPYVPIEQHDIEIQRNAAAWNKKPLLRAVYAEYYARIRTHLAPESLGPRLELGSGLGAIKNFIPDCITSDLFKNVWLDRQENAYALAWTDQSLGSLILFDVWHHLQYPGTALAEFHRVLRPGGRLILVEPATGLLGRAIYKTFHHEPIALNDPITWFAFPGFDPATQTYYAAQGNCWRMFAGGKLPLEVKGWKLVQVEQRAAIAYSASGGFSHPQLYPLALLPVVRWVDRLLDHAPNFFATRMIVVLERSP